jgi:hypothetical protein
MKEIFFLSGLPRAGNTLFGSLMNQNPKVAVTANSITADMMGELFSLKKIDIFQNYPDHKSFDNVAAKVFEHYYQDWKADYIIDRAPWGMPDNLSFLKHTRKNIKIIVLVRDVIEVLASFVRWSEREPTAFINKHAKTVEGKCDKLMNKEGVIVKELIAVKHLLRDENKGLYKIIEYNDLVEHPKKTIESIYKYLEIPEFKHSYINLDQFKVNDMGYDETPIGEGLHTIKTDVIRKSSYNAYNIIPKSIIEEYKQCNFWR